MGNSNKKQSPSNKDQKQKPITYQRSYDEDNKFMMIKFDEKDTEISNLLQQIFTSIGITLNGYLSIIEFYNIIKSGLLTEKWREIFPNNTRLAHYKSLFCMNEQVTRLVNNVIDDSNGEFNILCGMVDINLDKEMNSNKHLSYIVMYFVSSYIWSMTFGRKYLKPNQYVIQSINDEQESIVKSFKFNLKTKDIIDYWNNVKTLKNNKLIFDEKNFSVNLGLWRDLSIDFKCNKNNKLSFNNVNYKLFIDVKSFGGGSSTPIDLIQNDIDNIILPGFIDYDINLKNEKYFFYSIYSSFFGKWETKTSEYQFIFEQIYNKNNGKNLKYKMFMNCAKTNRVNESVSYFQEFLQVWDSILINHPLIGNTLKNIWDSGDHGDNSLF